MADRRTLARTLPCLVLAAGATLLLLLSHEERGEAVPHPASRPRAAGGTEPGDIRVGTSGAGKDERPTLIGVAGPRRPTHGPVRVRVQDRRGAPMVGIEVRVAPVQAAVEDTPRTQVAPGSSVTHATGEVHLPDLPYDGSTFVSVQRCFSEEIPTVGTLVDLDDVTNGLEDAATAGFDTGGSGHGSGATLPPSDRLFFEEDIGVHFGSVSAERLGRIRAPCVATPIQGPEATLTLDRELPLRVDVMEGGRGGPVLEVPVQAWPRWTAGEWPAPRCALAVRPGEEATVTVRPRAPSGWLAPAVAWRVGIHPLAQRLEAVVPLRPELDLRLQLPPECPPCQPDACRFHVSVAGAHVRPSPLAADGMGRLRVRGAAFYASDIVSVTGAIGSGQPVKGTARLGTDPTEPCVVQLHRTDRSGQDLSSAVDVVKPWDDWLEGHERRLPRLIGDEDGELRLKIVAWTGAPAVGARVELNEHTEVADASGRVRFRGVCWKEGTVRVKGAGATFEQRLPLSLDGTEQVLNAPAGGTLHVEVRDDEGREVPFPRIRLARADGLRHIEVVDGAQRLDPYADAHGRRTFRFVGAGDVAVKVNFGSRSARANVGVVEGGQETVRITLPACACPPSTGPLAPAERGEAASEPGVPK